MVTLLAKIFIKDSEDKIKQREAYGMLCGVIGILFNVLLFIGKFLAGTLSNSIAITADAFNNLSDAGSSIVTLLGFKLAGAKPDTEHPFGHGRMEYISGMLVSVAILVMGFELIRSSFGKLRDPELIERAALKETSLFTLANQCEITPPEAFVERFIGEDREVRKHGR